MTKETTNIWESYNFKKREGKSAFEYLNEQKNSFLSKSGGFLKLEVEAKNSDDYQTMTYDLYVVSEPLGNYRKKILSVLETDGTNCYPVTIMSPGLTDKVFSFVEENDFLNKLEEMISIPTIKRSIENLYIQSAEHLKDK